MGRKCGLLWTFVLVVGCPEGGGSPGAGVAPDDVAVADVADGPDVPTGSQGCAEVFIDLETGLCDPKPDDCPSGTIPVFTEGCVPTGITDCHPEFWNEEAGICDPDPDACGDYEVPVASEGCVSIDPPGGCGEGPWGAMGEQPGDVHVDPGYAGGDPDGTRENPWPLIGYGLGDVQTGDRLVLAAGIYEEGVLLAKSVHVVGRCASMVILAGVREGFAGPTSVEVKGDVEVGLSDVTVSGDGFGVTVHAGAQLLLERARVTDNRSIGLFVTLADTTVTATDLVVARTLPMADGTFGRGINVQEGATLSLARSLVIENHDVGLYASDADTTVTATDLVVARTLAEADGTGGRGVGVEAGAVLILQRASITNNHDIGLFVAGAGATVTATDLVVARTLAQADGTGGRGVHVQFGAALSLQRATVRDNLEGALIFLAGASGSVTDVMLSATGLSADPLGIADGLLARGSEVTATRVVARGNARAGFLFAESQATLKSCWSTGNHYGLVVNGDMNPDLSWDTVFAGNTVDQLLNAKLAVPDDTTPIPPLDPSSD